MRGYSASSPANATGLGSSSTQVLAANTGRQGLIMTNTGSTTIYLGIGVAAELGKGIVLAPNSVWNMGFFDYTAQQINAYSSGAGGSLSIQEF